MQGLHRVLCGHLYQVVRSAAFGHHQLHLAAVALAFEPLFDDVGFFDLVGQEHLLWHIGGFTVKLLDELTDHFGVRGFLGAFQYKVFAPHQFAVTDEEDLHTGFAFRAGNGQHI
ncbi:hypothetical protein SDC9_145664 [bioreactor metagenome]|uniref:Uncharacterized protein n=1 Tax=bioreactor metagenome TaxID=1076179 RepID=A0A645EA24_9ZZZZ